MSLPKQVQAQLEEAERLQQQYVESTQPQDPPNTDPTPDPDIAQQTPPEAQQEPPAPEPVQTPQTSGDSDVWERRFKTLQGKYNAEIPRYNAQLKDLTGQLETLQAQIEKLQSKPTETETKRPVTDKDVEVFGSDLIDLIDRKAQEVARDMVSTQTAKLEEENARLREQLSGVAERQVSNDRRAYFAELARHVPDYEAINNDQQFLDWLGQYDELSGRTRQDFLTEAWNSYDAARTAALFNAYKRAVSPPAPAPEPVNTKQRLERQVAPGTSKVSSSVPLESATRIWTMSEIDQFYKSQTNGTFRGTAEDRARIEAEIDQAVIDGRIR